MVYVPILETLQRLLQNETVVSYVLPCTPYFQIKRSHQSEDPDLGDLCDGEAFKRHPLFSVRTHSLQILFYYDDIEVCNPLGSKKIHKLGELLYIRWLSFERHCSGEWGREIYPSLTPGTYM